MVARNLVLATVAVVAATILPLTTAFAPQASVATTRASPLYIFGGKKEEEDYSDIEVRDLTREEMLEINRKNEEVMNMELGMMVSQFIRAMKQVTKIRLSFFCCLSVFFV